MHPRGLLLLGMALLLCTCTSQVSEQAGMVDDRYSLARENYVLGNYVEATDLANEVLQAAEDEGLRYMQAKTHHLLGLLYKKAGRYHESYIACGEAKRLYEKLGLTGLSAQTNFQLGKLKVLAADPVDANMLLTTALEQFQEVNDPTWQPLVYRELHKTYLQAGDTAKALAVLEPLAEVSSDTEIEALIAFWRGKIAFWQGDYAKALRLYSGVAGLLAQLTDKDLAYRIHHTKGLTHYMLGQHTEALGALETAIATLKASGAPLEPLIKACQDLAMVYETTGNKAGEIQALEMLLPHSTALGGHVAYRDALGELQALYHAAGNTAGVGRCVAALQEARAQPEVVAFDPYALNAQLAAHDKQQGAVALATVKHSRRNWAISLLIVLAGLPLLAVFIYRRYRAMYNKITRLSIARKLVESGEANRIPKDWDLDVS